MRKKGLQKICALLYIKRCSHFLLLTWISYELVKLIVRLTSDVTQTKMAFQVILGMVARCGGYVCGELGDDD